MAAGHRLEGDPVLAGKVDDVVEWGIRYVGEHFRSEIAGLVSGTLARWDAEETSRKLELLLALICSSSASTAPSSAASSASPSTLSAT